MKLYIIINVPSEMPDLNDASSGGSGKLIARKLLAIDKKLDNGVADTGSFCGINAFGNTTGDCHSNGAYRLDGTNRVCRASYTL